MSAVSASTGHHVLSEFIGFLVLGMVVLLPVCFWSWLQEAAIKPSWTPDCLRFGFIRCDEAPLGTSPQTMKQDSYACLSPGKIMEVQTMCPSTKIQDTHLEVNSCSFRKSGPCFRKEVTGEELSSFLCWNVACIAA